MWVPSTDTVTDVVMFFDGACYPKNPGGTMGVGVVIYSVKDFKVKNPGERYVKTKCSFSKRIHSKSITIHPQDYEGKTTCNVSEHMAFKYGIEWIMENLPTSPLKSVHIFGDSMMVVKQMNKEWSINDDKHYSDIAIDSMFSLEDLMELCRVNIYWIPREKNAEADLLSNPDRVKGDWEK